MESYLTITQINDFLFCPRSIYFSGIYHDSVQSTCFHQKPQTQGLAAHQSIDTGKYSSLSSILSGVMVYCEKYNLVGRIDLFDCASGLLTERKYAISAVYDGFRYQLYAQYFALQEMGYQVNSMRLHSLKDNKNYSVAMPNAVEIAAFEKVLIQMQNFSLHQPFSQDLKKCHNCIYSSLCDYYLNESN